MKIAHHRQAKITKQLHKLNEDNSFDTAITMAKDKWTNMAKKYQTDVRRVMINTAHAATTKVTHSFLQRSQNVWHAIRHLKQDNKRVWFKKKQTVATLWDNNKTVMTTYNLGADGKYVSKADRKKQDFLSSNDQ